MQGSWRRLVRGIAAAGLLWGASADGQLYRWTDQDGVIHYSDAPETSLGVPFEAVPGTAEAPAPAAAPPPATGDPPAAEIAGVPSEVLEALERLARRLHPTDQAARTVVVAQQRDAWRALQGYSGGGVPPALLASFFASARSQHPHDYVAQKYSVDVQVAAYHQNLASAAPVPPPPQAPVAPADATRIIESTTIVYPPYPGHRHPHPPPAAPKPYILYHPGPNAPRYGNTPDPVVLMPPGWSPLEERPEERRAAPPPPPTRPGRSGDARIGGPP